MLVPRPRAGESASDLGRWFVNRRPLPNPRYKGDRLWAHRSVERWLSSDPSLRVAAYRYARRFGLTRAAKRFVDYLRELGLNRTPDGACWSIQAVREVMRQLTEDHTHVQR